MTTENPATLTLRSVVLAMASNLRAAVTPGFRLALQDLRTRYARSLIGAAWEFIDPLVLAVVFILLKQSKILTGFSEEIPYALFVTSGILIFATFTDGLMSSVQSIHATKGLLNGARVYPETVIVSVFFRGLFNAAPRFFVIAGVVFWFDLGDMAGFLVLAFILMFAVLFGMAVGLLAAPFNCLYPDIGMLLSLITRPLLFVSGTVLPMPTSGWFGELNAWNPVALIVSAGRDSVSGVGFDKLVEMSPLILATASVLILAWYVFHVTMDLAAE